MLFPASDVVAHTDASPETPIPASGTPTPSGSLVDWQMVVAECKDGRDCTDQISEQNVETVMSEIGISS